MNTFTIVITVDKDEPSSEAGDLFTVNTGQLIDFTASTQLLSHLQTHPTDSVAITLISKDGKQPPVTLYLSALESTVQYQSPYYPTTIAFFLSFSLSRNEGANKSTKAVIDGSTTSGNIIVRPPREET